MNFRSIFFYLTGINFMALSKAKNILRGYTSPKPFDISRTKECIEYDIRVVDNWISQLKEYRKCDYITVESKNVLELGPGYDLGTGIYLISKGCAQYNCCDVNDLMKRTPDSFYNQFIEKLKGYGESVDIEIVIKELRNVRLGIQSKLNCIVRDDFDLVSAFGENTIDIVFSQAAFEHFDDINETARQLNIVCKPGAMLCAEIDLTTHSRWIRDKDPNNIYRYSNGIYNTFRFRGSPNRIRPYQYKEIFERNGWLEISIVPVSIISNYHNSYLYVHESYKDRKNQMGYLSFIFCAKNGDN